MRYALQQYGITEKPAGSNNVKYNTWFYGHAVRGSSYPWCGTFVYECGDKPSGDNPIAKSASAAYIQDETVRIKGGKYILKQTASNANKKKALSKYKFGDSISFNFSGGSSRSHTGLVIGVWGNNIWCIEGNTSFGNSGSQSNGGCVASRKRSYTTGVCVVRPKYSSFKWHVPSKPYSGSVPKLPSRGYFKYRDKSSEVSKLQKALAWANGYDLKADGEFGGMTFAEVVIFQVANGIEPDGEFGKASLNALNKLIKKHKTDNADKTDKNDKSDKTDKTDKETASTGGDKVAEKKTKGEKIYKQAMDCSWKSDTPKSKYKYPGGKRKKAYIAALKKAYGERKGWGKQTKAGASCDVFVGAVVRSCGVDPKFPRGRDEQAPYLKKSKKWKRVSRKKSNLKRGDIIEQKYKSGGSHIMIYLGGNKVANAHYNGKTYPIREKYSKIVKPASKCKFYRVYRAV